MSKPEPDYEIDPADVNKPEPGEQQRKRPPGPYYVPGGSQNPLAGYSD